MAGRFGVELCRVCKVRVILASDKGDTRVEHISEDISNDTLPHGAVRLMRNVLALRSLKRNVGRPRRWETVAAYLHNIYATARKLSTMRSWVRQRIGFGGGKIDSAAIRGEVRLFSRLHLAINLKFHRFFLLYFLLASKPWKPTRKLNIRRFQMRVKSIRFDPLRGIELSC